MPYKRSRFSIACTIAGTLGLLFGLRQPTIADDASRSLPKFIIGADVSLLTAMESQGIVYKDHGKPEDIFKILRSHGFNTIRLRLWDHPSGEGVMVNDLPYTIALAKRAKHAGLMVLLDIHYSDTWADPGKQTKPTAWNSMSTDQLTVEVRDYTRNVVSSMREADAMPEMVQIGNEITGGMLWPDGKDWGPGKNFTILGRLLKSGIEGAYDGAGKAPRPWIVIHIDKGSDWKGTEWFFDGIGAQGVKFDIIGESYYPQLNGPIAGLQETLKNAAAKYGKPVLIAETAYPSENNSEPITPGLAYPETPEGQRQFMKAIIDHVKATPNGLGAGICYWEPEWLPTKKYGGQWNTTALFDDKGNSLPAIDIKALMR